MLSLRTFLPAADKVRQVEFHPVQPWAISATKSDYVCVWDWSTKQVLYEMQFAGTGTGDEDLTLDSDLTRYHSRDGVYAPSPSAMSPPLPPKREGTGKVLDVKFLDAEVAQAAVTWGHLLASGASTPPPRAEAISALRGTRLVVIVCEAKVLIHDLSSKRTTELPKGIYFEGKTTHCVAFMFQAGQHSAAAGMGASGGSLMDSPILLFGCADGVVRGLNLRGLQPVLKLQSTHKSAVVKLLVSSLRPPADGYAGRRAVAVGHQGGSLVVYEPPSTHRPGGALVSPIADVKAHDKEIIGLELVPVAEDPERTRVVLFSAGMDNKLVPLEWPGLKEVGAKIKFDHKLGGSLTSMAHSPRGYVASGVHSILIGTEAGYVLNIQPVSGSIRMVAQLAHVLPAGAKKFPKVYSIAVHPAQPQLVMVGTNVGSALLGVDAPPPLAAAALPLQTPRLALAPYPPGSPPPPYGHAIGNGVTYVTAIGDHLLCVGAAAVRLAVAAAPATGPAGQDLTRLDWHTTQITAKLAIASGTPSGRASVLPSADGSYVAVVWHVARTYAVYRQGAAAWQEVTRGSGSALAWHASRPTFAILADIGGASASQPGGAAASAGGGASAGTGHAAGGVGAMAGGSGGGVGPAAGPTGGVGGKPLSAKDAAKLAKEQAKEAAKREKEAAKAAKEKEKRDKEAREKELKEAAKAAKAAAKASKDGKGKDKDKGKGKDSKAEEDEEPHEEEERPSAAKDKQGGRPSLDKGAGPASGAGAGASSGPRVSAGQLISIDSGPALIELAPSPAGSMTRAAGAPGVLGSLPSMPGSTQLGPNPLDALMSQPALPPPAFATSAADTTSTPGTIMIKDLTGHGVGGGGGRLPLPTGDGTTWLFRRAAAP